MIAIKNGFDIVAIIISVLLLVVYRGKTKSNMKLYNASYWILIATMIAPFSHILLFVVCTFTTNMMLAHILNIIFSVSYVLIICVFGAFVVYLVGVDFIADYKWFTATVLPCILQIILYIATPACGFMYKFDRALNYYDGFLHYSIYILLAYFAIIWFVAYLRYRKAIDKRTRHHLVLLPLSMLILGAVVYYTRDYSIISFCSVIVLMIVMYSLKNPDEIFDPSNAIHKKFLIKDVSIDFLRERHFATTFITLHDLDIMYESFGELDINVMLKNIIKYFGSLGRGIKVYRIDTVTFAIVIQYKKKDKIRKIRDEIMDRFLDEWRINELSVRIPISMATLYVPVDTPSIEDYKSAVKFFTSTKLNIGQDVDAAVYRQEDKQQEIIEAVERATKNNEFEVYYQPIYSTNKKKIVAAEALIRLYDEKLGFISPEIFIPLAEQEGYILDIGRFVFEEVCRFFSEKDLASKGIEYIEVNLSALQCMQYKLAEEFLGIMKKYNVKTNQINFEITETSAMASSSAVSININSFVDEGIDLSLDDYGTGYSNLSYLYHLPFSFVKIDKSILWSADSNSKANITLANIFGMAKNLNMRIVVEGVETEEQIKKLLKLKCDYFQGFYFSKPIPGDDFVKYISEFTLPEVCK